MRFSKSVLIGGITVLAGVKADGWSSSAAPASTLWSTQVITVTLPASTVSIPYTLTSTVDIYETTTVTITSISISVVTSTATQYSEKDFTYTVSVTDDFTTTIYQPTTLTDFITQSTTITDFVTQPTTVISPTTTTVEQPTTVTLVDSITITSTPLTGIVLCPSRTVNPTYTAPSPFPYDYTWGCPPGTVCTPPKINCNFEQNPPADTYYCSPDECLSVGALPNLTLLEASAGTTCGPFPTISTEPFNFNPSYFGLGYTIFECGGDWAETCSGGSTTTTTTTTATDIETLTLTLTPPTATETDVETVTLTPPTATETNVETVTLTPPTATETDVETVTLTPPTTTETEIETITTTTTSLTSVWSSTGWGRLAKRAQILPAKCYANCNNCLEIVINDGKKTSNCVTNGPFSVAYTDCESCISVYQGGVTVADQVLPSLSQFVSYCNIVSPTAKAKRQGQSTLAVASPTPETPPNGTPPATTAKASLTRRRPRYAIN